MGISDHFPRASPSQSSSSQALQSSSGGSFQTTQWKSRPSVALTKLRPKWPLSCYPWGKRRPDGSTLTLLLSHGVSSQDIQREGFSNGKSYRHAGSTIPERSGLFLESSVTFLSPLSSRTQSTSIWDWLPQAAVLHGPFPASHHFYVCLRLFVSSDLSDSIFSLKKADTSSR